MLKRISNNKGSTMVLLVVAIAVISLLGTSILGVTMMNYKIKKTNSDLKYSFYMSETGLDIAYAEAYAVILQAVEDANDAAQKEFERHNEQYRLELSMAPELNSNIIEDSDGDGIYEYIQEEIKRRAKAEFEGEYVNAVKDNIIDSLNGVNSDGILLSNSEKLLKLDIDTDESFNNFSFNTPMKLSISSKFTKIQENITKTTDVDLIITVPEYNDSFTVGTIELDINPFWTKVMTAENLNIEKRGNTTFNGEVLVNKSLNLTNSGNVTFMQDLAVKNNINIKGSKRLNTKNVYTSNIFMEGKDAAFFADTEPDAMVVYPGVVVSDDLEMNASGQKVEINGSYYGFGYGGEEKDNTKNSSIIINNKDIDGFTVNNGDFYLLGTSYIKGIAPYATGESLSVRGNYKVYTIPLTYNENGLPGKYDSTNIEFNYEDYMPYFPQLLENVKRSSGAYTELTALEKAEYIVKYDELVEHGGLNLEPLEFADGKIKFNNSNIVALASVINGTQIGTGGPIEDWPTMHEAIKSTFDTKIKKLGFKLDGESELTTEEIFNNIKYDFDFERKKGNELVYVNKVTRSFNDGKKYVLPANVNSGLIITNEDVEISGTVDFTGVIICGGDINILDDGEDKVFYYNKGIVSYLIAEHGLHDTVFKDTTSVGTISMTTFGSGDNDINVDFRPLLKLENWSIQ